MFRHGEDLRASYLSTPSLAVPVLCLQGPCAQAQGPHLCQTQVPRVFVIGAWPNLVHVCDLPRFALVFVNCMLKPPPPPTTWYRVEIRAERSDKEKTFVLPDFNSVNVSASRASVGAHLKSTEKLPTTSRPMSFQTAAPSPTSRRWWLALLGPMCTGMGSGVVFRAMCKGTGPVGPCHLYKAKRPCTLVLGRREDGPHN